MPWSRHRCRVSRRRPGRGVPRACTGRRRRVGASRGDRRGRDVGAAQRGVGDGEHLGVAGEPRPFGDVLGSVVVGGLDGGGAHGVPRAEGARGRVVRGDGDGTRRRLRGGGGGVGEESPPGLGPARPAQRHGASRGSVGRRGAAADGKSRRDADVKPDIDAWMWPNLSGRGRPRTPRSGG